MVEAFKTNVQKKAQSKMLLCILSEAFPSFKINFDLSDCDKVLRVEGDNMEALPIIILVKEYGFKCEILQSLLSIVLVFLHHPPQADALACVSETRKW